MRITRCLACMLTLLGLCALPLVAAANDCASVDGIDSICGLAAPEDLVPAPNGRDLIFGQMAGPGGIYILDTRDDTVHPLLSAQPLAPDDERWGDAACRQPTSRLEAHGLDLRQRADGRWQLLVVNHAERESVEFYELQYPASDRPSARWRGCAEAPAEGNFNDVAGLADGSLLVTHMADRRWPLASAVLAALGRNTGFVYHWTRDAGFTPLPATQAAHPNGILLAPDEQSFFLSVYLGNALQHRALPGGELLGSVAVPKPDNASWSDNGQPLGAGTVALQRGNFLYIGSYVGDRIIRLPLPLPGSSGQ